MPNYTANYNLEKPIAETENYDVNVFNLNADKIDTELKNLDNKINGIEIPVTSVNEKTGAVTLNATDVGAETPAGAQAKADAAAAAAIAAHEDDPDPHEQYALDTELAALQNEIDSHKAECAKFVADYEYQSATVVGTQIRVSKQSDTAILKFRLDTDLSGGAITISLDAGATSKPLVDINGAPVIELEKGFVEVVENAVNFTYAPKGASLKEGNELILLAELSINDGAGLQCITSDDNYLYADGNAYKVYKLNKSNLSKVAESSAYDGGIISIAFDDNYLYVGTSANKVYKLNKSNLSTVAESSTYGDDIRSIASDDNYLYVSGGDYNTQKVYKLNKSNLSKVAESSSYGGNIYSITSDANYLYVGGSATHQKVYKLNKSNLSKVAESSAYDSYIQSIASDDNYLYVGGYNTQKVYKLNKSDLNKVAESISYGAAIYSIASDDNYIYVGAAKVYKLNKSNLSTVAESSSSGNRITSDDNYIYVGAWNVYKLSKTVYLYKNLKLVVMGSV